MPRLSDTMQEGTIASWLKKPGDSIDRGEVIAQIETDKATMDLTAFEAGTLQEILAPGGATVPIGQTVARLGSGAPASPDSGSDGPPRVEQPAPPPRDDTPAESAAQPDTRVETAEADGALAASKVRASPMARHIAAERGLDLRAIRGS